MARGALPLVAAAMAALAVALALSTASAGVEFSDSDLATEESAWALYERWIAHHGVARCGAKKTRRFRVFRDNMRRVRDFHHRYPSYKMGMNNFGNMTDGEVATAYPRGELPYGCGEVQSNGDNLPKTVSDGVRLAM